MIERKLKLDNLTSDLEKKYNMMAGQLELLKKQNASTIADYEKAKENSVLNIKALELLNYIQKETKDTIINVFENVVTKALQFIHQSDAYRFELEFGQRGNIPELNFNLKTPDLIEAHSIVKTRAGGSQDIIALALRFVLLEISKTPGFIFLDEPEKRLDNADTIKKMIEFIKETQQNTKRQIFIITHADEMVESVENPIIIQRKEIIPVDKTIKETKKRGRPKKEIENDGTKI